MWRPIFSPRLWGEASITEQVLNGQKGTKITFGSGYSTRYQLCFSNVEGWSTGDLHQKCLHGHSLQTGWRRLSRQRALVLQLLPTLPFKEVDQRLMWQSNSLGRFHQANWEMLDLGIYLPPALITLGKELSHIILLTCLPCIIEFLLLSKQ